MCCCTALLYCSAVLLSNGTGSNEHLSCCVQDLVNALASKLLELPTHSDPNMVANRAQNVRDAIDALPRLNQGMDLNLVRAPVAGMVAEEHIVLAEVQ